MNNVFLIYLFSQEVFASLELVSSEAKFYI